MTIQSMKERITKAIAEGDIDVKGIQFEYPADLSHGDLSSNIAMVRGGETGVPPKEIAEKIVSLLHDIDGIEKVEIAGPGFINFYLTNGFFAENINSANNRGDLWGKDRALDGQEIMVEYTDPNPFKEFHIGHLMSNAIGEAIARVIEFSGAKVIRANYQGDVGPQIAMAVWGVKKLGIDPSNAKKLGDGYAVGATAYKEDEDAKKEIDEINKVIYENKDGEIINLYKKGREASLNHFEEIYKKLGTKFDHYFFESETGSVGAEIVKAHMGVFEESDGAIVYKGEKVGLHTRVFINSNSFPTYEGKEIGLEKMKMDLYPNVSKLIIVTGNEITDYFRVVKAALHEIFPDIAKKLVHIPHGMMKLTSRKMSSRTGDVVSGESLIEEMTKRANERSKESRAEDKEKLAQQIAIAAIKYQILKQSAGKDIAFDETKAFSIEGDSGPYLQYAHARARTVVDKAAEEKIEPAVDATAETNELSRLLYRFPDVVERAAVENEPHLIATFLSVIASSFNSWYSQEQILDGTKAAAHKVALTQATAQTLKNGLWLLGIEAPERM
jgi:arginyl-tRNA synthetase